MRQKKIARASPKVSRTLRPSVFTKFPRRSCDVPGGDLRYMAGTQAEAGKCILSTANVFIYT